MKVKTDAEKAKADLRQKMRFRLKEFAGDTADKSRQIFRRLMTLTPFQDAWQTGTLMSFVSMPEETDTFPLFGNYPVVVPYCCEDELLPIRIFSVNELESGRMGIMEPQESVRQNKERQVNCNDLRAVLVPGLAFDPAGNRLGRGKGFYDRFLRRLPPSVLTIGLAFEWMICDSVPVCQYDYPVELIVTENRLLETSR